jgi:hypothetical protein
MSEPHSTRDKSSKGAGSPKWPTLVGVLAALALWGVYFAAKLDHQAIGQGDKSSLYQGLGAGVVFLLGGVMVRAFSRDAIKPKLARVTFP